MSQSQKKRERRALLGDRTIRDSVERLTSYEAKCSDAIPKWWEMMDHLRAQRATKAAELPGGWPEWCLFPTPELHKVIPTPGKAGGVASQMRNALIARMLGLYAWRQGRTVWHFDSDVAAALVETEDMGQVPAEILRRLPQWGVYIQRPGIEWRGDARPPAGVNKFKLMRWSNTCEVIAAQRGKEFAFLRPGSDKGMIWRYTFEAVGDGTRVTESWYEESLPPAIQRGVMGVMMTGRDLDASVRTTLQRIKAAVET